VRKIVAIVALLVVGSAPAAIADRSLATPAPVIALARSSWAVASVSGPTAAHCGGSIQLWDLFSRGVWKLGRHLDVVCNEGPSTGSGISAVAVSGFRVLWLFHAGGNLTDWVLYTATATSPAERKLEFQEVETGDKSPILVGDASELVLPYAVGRTVKGLSPTGKLLYTWTAPADVNALTSYGNQVAVYMSGGKAVVLSATGAVAQSYEFPLGATAVKLGRDGIVVQLGGGKIEIRKGATLVKTLTLPAGGQMTDHAEGIVLYSLGTQLRAVRASSGKDVGLRTLPTKPFLAQLEPNGLSYAIGKNVYSVAMVNVQAAIG
jgi:hypothetical protein